MTNANPDRALPIIATLALPANEMSALSNPSDIARETLRRLALQRIPPTPDNYLRLYHEIAGTDPGSAEFPTRFVGRLARRLPRDTVERQRLARQLDQALAGGDVTTAERSLDQYLDGIRVDASPGWNELIGRLLRQWEGRQLGWTTARKRESLERVLLASDPATLFARLQALLNAWGQSPTDPELPSSGNAPAVDSGPAPAAPAPTVHLLSHPESAELLDGLRALLLQTLESVIPAFLCDEAELVADAQVIAATVRGAADRRGLDVAGRQLRKFALRLEGVAIDATEIRSALLGLLRLLVRNIDELVIDDRWLHGQIETLRTLIDQPLDIRLLDDAELHLKDVIYKQSQLKHDLTRAQQQLKAMLSGFVDQLASFSASTDSYQGQLDHCARQIAAAHDIADLGKALDQVMSATSAIQDETRRSREELAHSRERVQHAEAEIAAMQQALDEAGRARRHDRLTEALNRSALETLHAREAERAARHHKPLCLALLDIDNFRRLNEAHGQGSADAALRHLAGTVRQFLRPHDALARYSDEEFALLFPETALDAAEAALIRLQRELTRSFFMSGQQKLVITFSAGVTPCEPGEALDAAVARAHAAVDQARRSGKNQVVALPAN